MESIISIARDMDKLPTLRDQFAMAAMNAEVSSYASYYRDLETFTKHCYNIADAMLKARKEN